MQDGLAARLQDALADGNLLHASIQLELGTPIATAAPPDGPAASPEVPLDAPEETAMPLPLAGGEEDAGETPPAGEEKREHAGAGGKGRRRDPCRHHRLQQALLQ
jgi:hypothetical protein